MNKRPVSYFQTDKRWKSTPYRVKGEDSTIGDSGCGPTCAAMLLSTLTGRTVTPVDTCKWSVEHGYKALHQGTYYGYFKPQLAAFGIDCWQLSWTNTYHNPRSKIHDQALEYLKRGYYLIALMKKGTWTGGGHFVVVWWADGKIRINDPASTQDRRVNGDPATFRNEAAYYWVVDARAYNNEEEIDMSRDEVKALVRETVLEVLDDMARQPATWEAEVMQKAKDRGLMDGTRPKALLTRGELAQVLHNLSLE